MKVSYKTDPGKKRDHNEDSIMVDKEREIFLLADGMGGHLSGEWASRMAVEVAYDHVVSSIKKKITDDEISEVISQALLKAHDTIKMSATIDFNFRGMGTTLVIMVIKENQAYICHAGDSRVYLIGSNIIQITKDHTLGNFLLDYKKKEPEEIPIKAWHTLTQAVGVSEKLSPHVNNVRLRTGDILLMCSDGLTDMLTDKEIYKIVQTYKVQKFDRLADILIHGANKKGGRDNISVTLVKYEHAKVPLTKDPFWHTSFTSFERKEIFKKS